MKLKLTVALALGVATSMSMAQEVVKIGHVAPLSGAIAHLGKDNEYGARLAIEELNAKARIAPINDTKMENNTTNGYT